MAKKIVSFWGLKFEQQFLDSFEIFNSIDNYIYLYHIDKFILLPSFIDTVTDQQSVTFQNTNILTRSAPIYSYSYSGPRSLQVRFDLHRDLMMQINKGVSNVPVTPKIDYIDKFIKYIQASVVPEYQNVSKMVDPPIVALRLGNDIFIKGIISGSLGITYGYPILEDGRYARVSVQFNINEIDPYDALQVSEMGSYRIIDTRLERLLTNSASITGSNNRALSGGRNESDLHSHTSGEFEAKEEYIDDLWSHPTDIGILGKG